MKPECGGAGVDSDGGVVGEGNAMAREVDQSRGDAESCELEQLAASRDDRSVGRKEYDVVREVVGEGFRCR